MRPSAATAATATTDANSTATRDRHRDGDAPGRAAGRSVTFPAESFEAMCSFARRMVFVAAGPTEEVRGADRLCHVARTEAGQPYKVGGPILCSVSSGPQPMSPGADRHRHVWGIYASTWHRSDEGAARPDTRVRRAA